jgi:hypothetical protein
LDLADTGLLELGMGGYISWNLWNEHIPPIRIHILPFELDIIKHLQLHYHFSVLASKDLSVLSTRLILSKCGTVGRSKSELFS